MQKSNLSEIRTNKIIAFLSLGVIVYCVAGLFSNDLAKNAYAGSILLFLSFVSLGFLALKDMPDSETNSFTRANLDECF